MILQIIKFVKFNFTIYRKSTITWTLARLGNLTSKSMWDCIPGNWQGSEEINGMNHGECHTRIRL